jgi:hypothetical protein
MASARALVKEISLAKMTSISHSSTQRENRQSKSVMA